MMDLLPQIPHSIPHPMTHRGTPHQVDLQEWQKQLIRSVCKIHVA